MTKEQIFDKCRAILVDQLGCAAEEVTPEATFTETLGADSLDLVELIMAVEEEWGIEIPEEDAEKVLTVQGAVDYIAGRVG